ncbi:hypothetical protein BH24PSE2_BH24PSE2_16980 [soil metagenome]
MSRPSLWGIARWYRELRRRKVLRVAALYAVSSWVVIEVASVVFPELMLPEWSVRLVIALVALGLPIVLVLAWIFDITPVGVERTASEAPGPPAAVRPEPPRRSLAVLPFRNIGGDRENEYFCEGLAEDLLIVLSRVQGLRVAARSSAFAFGDGANDVRDIGEKLNVANVLEGSVRRSDGHLRIAMRLLDTANGYQRWAQVFDREVGDIFEIQDEISRAVVDALDVEVYGAKHPQITPGTRDVEAYHLYLMGRYQLHKRTEESLRSAVRFFEQAIERDSSFALPYTGLADSYALLSASGEGYGPIPIEESIARATPLVERALTLEPQLAEAHASRGFIDRLRSDFAGAERALRRALELNPGYPAAHAWLGLTLTDRGRLREALAEFERASEADPLSPIIGANLGFAQLKVGELDAARERFDRVLEIAPDFTVAHAGMAAYERRRGRYDAARKWWERAIKINPKRAYYPARLALLQLEAGDSSAASDSVNLAESIAPNDPVVVRARMTVLIATGNDAGLLSFTEERLEGERSTTEALANAALAQLIGGQPVKALHYYLRAGGDLQQWILASLVWSWRFPHGLHCAAALLRTGEQDGGGALLDDAWRLCDRLENEGLVNPDLEYQRAAILALRGDYGESANAIARAEANGWQLHWWARRDPALAGLRERNELRL